MDLNRLFLLSRELTDSDRNHNKYTFWAGTVGFSNYRIASLDTVLRYEGSVGSPLPPYLVRFINECGEVLLIANVINRQVTQLVVRALHEKRFQTVVLKEQFPYGLGTISLKKEFREPVVVVEGTLDRDYLRTLYPNVVACLTSSLTRIQLELLTCITNTVILGYDNDETGRRSFYKDKDLLEKRGIYVKRLQHPAGLKDPGDVPSLLYEGDQAMFNIHNMYYKLELNRLISEVL